MIKPIQLLPSPVVEEPVTLKTHLTNFISNFKLTKATVKKIGYYKEKNKFKHFKDDILQTIGEMQEYY